VHQVLAFVRIHDEALSDEQGSLRAYPLNRIAFVRGYGNSFLIRAEYDRRLKELLDYYYYDVLASAFVRRSPEKFWSYHKGRLEEIGLPFDRGRYVRAVLRKMIDLVCNPKQTIEKTRRRKSAD